MKSERCTWGKLKKLWLVVSGRKIAEFGEKKE
jgi:hypothetical protein